MPQIKWRGKDVDALEIRFKSVHEEWSQYDLEDGSTIRMKLVVTEIFRVEGEYDPENNPVYVIKSGNMAVVKSPDDLKRK